MLKKMELNYLQFRAMYQFAPNQQQIRNAVQQDIKKQFTRFLVHFQGGKYLRMMKSSAEQGGIQNVLLIKNQDLFKHNYDLGQTIFQQYYKYEKLLNEAFAVLMRDIQKQQGENLDHNVRQGSLQKYFIAFQSGLGGNNDPGLGIRDLTCSKIGKLEKLRGTITRTTQVRPQLVTGVFKCRMCRRFSKPVQQQFKYTEPKRCLNQNCDSKSWQLDLSKSQFADFQQLRVQQDPNTIPAGSMPRSINVILRNYNVQKAQPGDICKFVGYLCVTPQIVSMLKPGQRTTLTTRNLETRGNMMEMDGVKGVTGIRQLNYKLVFIANNVTVQNKQYNDIDEGEQEQQVMPELNNEQHQKEKLNPINIYEKLFANYSQSEMKQITQLRQNPRLYEDLADSLFPGIFGHPQIKKAILLQLFGGVHKVTLKNKINIRGDINILIVGDPSTAKSQFLKTVNKFVARSVYTNGKTTSAAGLTASVMRDDLGNVGIQAGALMLADNGICCIDQFDKMDLKDMTAIHEAMEQQTISIAKAGVHATLNARTSILAAANPLFGRYDKTKNLQRNINISAPIMSRFDLYFVICDQSNINSDRNLCQFMINMHREKQASVSKRYNTKTLRFYISVARKLKPVLTNKAARKLRQCYINVRRNCKQMGQGLSYLATVRQLQSMIRLSQALAKLHLDLEVTQQHVQQAYRLIQNSITKLQKADVILQEQNDKKQSKVQEIINQEYRKKKDEKKKNVISLSAQAYDEITNNILFVFKKQRQLRKQRRQQKANILLHQGNVINFIISIQLEKGTLNTEQQEKNFRKLVVAVIKKMIKEQRKLMVEEDNDNDDLRVLKLHPNYLATLQDKQQNNIMNLMSQM